jgi:predicted RNA binding protein YcfA (HicA-like mRNA interferase family)
MERLPTLSARQVMQVLERAGFSHHHTRGSHYYFKHPDRPRPVPVPYHARDIKRGLLRAIIQQAGMTVEEFLELL